MDEKESLSLDKGREPVPPMAFGAKGYDGLVTLGGNVWEDCARELIWPHAYHTYKKMALSAAVSPALEFIDSKVLEAQWTVKTPKGYENDLKDDVKFLTQIMSDMDQSWNDVIRDAATFGHYGFSVLEIVPRYRNKIYGSKHDDGFVGLKGLYVRSQGSVDGWYWKDKGRTLAGVKQKVSVPTVESDDWRNITNQINQIEIVKIPRKKFLLFRHNPENNSPVGTSPLKAVWSAWKLLEAFQESEIISVAQDSNAFKILYLPPEYLMDNADEDRKKSFQMYQQMMERAHQAKQSGFILPMLTDAEGNRLFEFDIKNISGQKAYDIEQIISRLTREIQVGLFSDVLSMGGDGGGSYNLSETKIALTETAVKARLNVIKDQLNHHLIPLIYEQNGWSTEVLPYFDFALPDSETLDNKGKFIQRVKAVGMLPMVPEVVNHILRDYGFDYQLPDNITAEELKELLGTATSESGNGMKQGMNNTNGNDTSDNGDASISNTSNT